MKKVLKYLGITIFSGLCISVFILMLIYSPTYVYRLIKLNVGDVYDYKYFNNRPIIKSDSTYYFEKRLDEEYVESLFSDEINISGLNSFDEYIDISKTTALIFIQRDTILYEKYFNGFGRDSLFLSQSMAKSFISFLIGAAIEDGYIESVNDPLTKYVPELKVREAGFEKITIKNLLMMRTGLKYYEGYFPFTNYIHLPWHDEAVGYYHEDVRKLLLEDVKIAYEPGTTYQYCNYSTSYLGLIIERVTGKTVSKYLEEKLWTQTGMEYDALFTVDDDVSFGFEYVPSRLVARAIDYAKFGRLYLNNGNWNGKQLISNEWVSESTLEDKSVPREYYPDYMGSGINRVFYKYQWWGHTNQDGTYNLFASGNYGQTIYIIPHEQIIIVHCGNSNALYNSHDLWQVERNIRHKEFNDLIEDVGVAKAIESYKVKRTLDPSYLMLDERFINLKGYAYLNSNQTEEALLLFALNVALYPNSSNVYDSLGEAYMIIGDNEKAVFNYKRSVKLNPNNQNGIDKLKELGEDIKKH